MTRPTIYFIDPLKMPNGLITKQIRTKKFKKALNKFVQHVGARSQEPRAKMDLEKHITLIELQDQPLIHLIQV